MIISVNLTHTERGARWDRKRYYLVTSVQGTSLPIIHEYNHNLKKIKEERGHSYDQSGLSG